MESSANISKSKVKFSLILNEAINFMPNSIEDFHSQSSLTSFGHLSSRNQSDRERELLFQKTLEILMKSGEQRTPKDIRMLLKSTENFQYFQRFKEKPSTEVLHSRFCRVMKLRQLKKGETLFYAGTHKL